VSPEQLLGVRDDPRSDLFGLGVVLYELATGRLPFGAPTTEGGLRRRLYRDPVPPRALRPEVPPWLQEIVLACLEIDPAGRPACAEDVAEALSAPARVPLGPRAYRTRREGARQVVLRWLRAAELEGGPRTSPPPVVAGRRMVVVAVATAHANEARHAHLREAVGRVVCGDGSCRLTCVTVLAPAPWDEAAEAPRGSRALHHLDLLRRWAAPLGLPDARISFHVLEGSDPTETLLEFVRANPVHHLLVGARPPDAPRWFGGTVSSRLADDAPCDVTVVRYPS
jgi:nucleotide-binding universal stress UspA family protein